MSQSDSAENTAPIHAEFHEAVKQLEAMPNMGPVKKVLGILHRMVDGKAPEAEKTVDIPALIADQIAQQSKNLKALVDEAFTKSVEEVKTELNSDDFRESIEDIVDKAIEKAKEEIMAKVDKKQDKPQGA